MGEKIGEKNILYNELAPYYDLIVEGAGQDTEKEADFLENILKDNGANKVLDLACETGRHVCALKKRGFEATGIDISEKMLEQARKKCGAHFIQGDIRKKELEKKFDAAIIMWTTINTFTDKKEVKGILRGIKSNLKDNGILILDSHTYPGDQEKEKEEVVENKEVRVK